MKPKQVQRQEVHVVSLDKHVLNRSLLYCAIPCVVKDTYKDGETCSIRWQGLCKGNKGGFFPSAMIVQMWHRGKEWHTKVNRTGAIHMTGIPNKETAIEITELIAQLLSNAAKYINSVSSCPTFAEAMEWLSANSTGPVFECVSTFTLRADKDLGSMEFCKVTPETSIKWPDVVPRKYSKVVGHMKILCDDLLRNTNAAHCALLSRIHMFIGADHQEEAYMVSGSRLCNSICRDNLGKPINRYELVDVLTNEGYDTYFPNSATSEVVVHMKVNGVSAKFRFDPCGAIGVHCADNDIADRVYATVMKVVNANIDRITL